jgi:hypothetical protein
LIGDGELDTYLDGRSRKITVASIHRRIARLLATAGATGAYTEAAPPRRRGQPPKSPASSGTTLSAPPSSKVSTVVEPRKASEAA